MRLKTRILVFLAILVLLVFSCAGSGQFQMPRVHDLFIQDDNKENDITLPDFVEPLLKTKWGQGSPYNLMYPKVPNHRYAYNDLGELSTDCGNTAISQIMAFHRHPQRGSGESSIIRPHNINVPSVNLSDNPFEWNNMLNEYTKTNPGTAAQQNAVAKLLYLVGLAGGINGSKAFSSYLVENFDYDKSLQYHYRVFYTDAEWEMMIKKQLVLNLPVYYWGTGGGSSHAFVIDGYNNSGEFHINMGWDGRDDNWYSLNNINPSVFGSESIWNNDQFIIINIKPNEGSTGSNEMGLMGLTVTKNSVSQNELFTVTPTIRSFGFFPGGHAGAALVDNNGNIVTVTGINTMSSVWRPGANGTLTLNCYVPETVNTGLYRLQIATRPTDGEWKVVTASDINNNIPNAIPFTVTAGEINGGGYGFGLRLFSSDTTTASAGGQVTVTYKIMNVSAETIPAGQYGIALVDNSGKITVIQRFNRDSAWGPGTASPDLTVSCTIPAAIGPGQYKLRAVARLGNNTDNNPWRIITMSLPDVPNSIDFTVR